MEDIKILQNEIENQFEKMQKDSKFLFTLGLEKDELWNIYLNGFREEDNKIFRERREHDCSACRQFVNNFGDVVAIINNKIVSIWDFEIDNEVYKPVIKALKQHVKNKPIRDIFVTKLNQIGIEKNFEESENGTILTWRHMYIKLPSKFVFRGESVATEKGKYRDIKQVFKRSLEEISEDSVETILELIEQNSLYRGSEWKQILIDFNKYQKEYKKLNDIEKDIYLWNKAINVGISVGKIRNHSIGTLLVNITEGVDLEVAVKKYEDMVAPTNYKRPKPIFTPKMLEDAKKKIEELGYLESLERRFAILEDININNVLFSNTDSSSRLQKNNVFDELKEDIGINPKQFNRVEEVSIKDFITNILPKTQKVEVLLENQHAKNMVSLIAPKNANSKTMFKWNNNFSWAYAGNITDSDLKTNVKSAGGDINGILRFSIQWNDLDTHNNNDLDAHCVEPNKNRIYFSHKSNPYTTGKLDVDIISPIRNKPAVENITWTDKSKMLKGVYLFSVHNYSQRQGKDGFKAEIEFNGEIYKFEYRKPIPQNKHIEVAEVTFDGENFTIKELLKGEQSSRKIWNVKTHQFIPVSVIMNSPNYWDEQKGIGNQHYFFMLKDCINNQKPNGFFNEFLNNELTEHRKVFEALGSKMSVEDMDNQLSGIGFSTTQRNNLIIKIQGKTERVLKINI
jgi:hypothetical protein